MRPLPTIFVATLTLAAASSAVALTASAAPRLDARESSAAPHDASFVLKDLRAGSYDLIGRVAAANRSTDKTGIAVLQLANGDHAVVDKSLLRTGAASAATTDTVRLAWAPRKVATGYAVLRDNRLIARLPAGADQYADEAVRPGASYNYVVTPLGVPKTVRNHPVWGMHVNVPAVSAGESGNAAVARQARVDAKAVARASTTTLSWVTFIPQAKVNAPAAGCSYGSGYQFGGDNRSFDWTSSKYRTALHATITWSSKGVVGNKAVGTTHVYKTSTGNLVSQKTASTGDMESRKLGSGSNYVDIRMVNHAKNPFCTFGAIDGAITIKLTSSGNWEIRSGTYRRMPNHEIYIYNGGAVTWVHKSTYQSVTCLIGPAACDETNLTGYYGSYS